LAPGCTSPANAILLDLAQPIGVTVVAALLARLTADTKEVDSGVADTISFSH
jgi:hypothetical protein